MNLSGSVTAATGNGGAEDGTAPALGPPLEFVPETTDPVLLQAYRIAYQAWRDGQAAGARGEIVQLPASQRKRKVAGVGRDDSWRAVRESTSGKEVEAYYSEPERDAPFHPEYKTLKTPWQQVGKKEPTPTSPQVGAVSVQPASRGRSAAVSLRGASPCSSSSSSISLPKRHAISLTRLPTASVSGVLDSADLTEAVTFHSAAGSTETPAALDGTSRDGIGTAERPRLDFGQWLSNEMCSRPDESQLDRVPCSHLPEVASVPWRLEKVLGFGILFCLDILLHELSFMPLQVVLALPRLLRPGDRHSQGQHRLTITEQCNMLRLLLLLLNVGVVFVIFDVSWVYHYIRTTSFLKLYVIFNMLEMFERWCRSVGVDLFDLVMASARQPWRPFLPKFAATFAYCIVHSSMHLVRVLLLNVAINTSSSAMFLIIVTNNFGEIKSTVFKRYEVKNLFPIITSDIVERFYLATDIIFVLARLFVAPRRGNYSAVDIGYWLFLLVAIELGTDWVKFCLIIKFSEMPASTLEIYKEVLIADILLCRIRPVASRDGTAESTTRPTLPPPAAPFRGIHSFSQAPATRIGFSGVPISTLVVIHVAMLLRSPCSLALSLPRATAVVFLASACALAFLAKVLLGLFLLGYAARRRGAIVRGLELFTKIKAL